MDRVFSGLLSVHYRLAYVLMRDVIPSDLSDAFRGQTNGLCGAATRGAICLITGLHTGYVGFSVDVLDAAPPLDDDWEEIVETSFAIPDEDEEFENDGRIIAERDVAIVEWGGKCYPFPLLPGSYRVRYCARGMDLGRHRDTTLTGEAPVDFYSLAFWPADPAPDCVIKQTSEAAAYWHKHALSCQAAKDRAAVRKPVISEGISAIGGERLLELLRSRSNE